MRLTHFLITIGLTVITVLQGQDSNETFDPGELKDPEPNWPTVVNPLFKGSTEVTEDVNTDTAKKNINGYRVQVLATKYTEKADSLMQILNLIYNDEAYVTYEAPYYKVRVGNCIDRKQAEELQHQLRDRGYSSAWIIRTRIEVGSAYQEN